MSIMGIITRYFDPILLVQGKPMRSDVLIAGKILPFTTLLVQADMQGEARLGIPNTSH